jgi:hypothetical protein
MKWTWIGYALLPVLPALSQFYFKSTFYGLALIAGGAVLLMVSRPLNRILLWETCLIIVLFGAPSAVTWLGLAYIGEDSLRYFAHVQSNFDTADTGLEVLPAQVQQIRSLLAAHHVSSYRLSPQLQEPHSLQRVVEGTWPIKLEPASAYRFRLVSEATTGANCVELDRAGEVALDLCH